MDNAKGNKYLSDYITEKIDISKLGKKTCIVSGVGSGKNYWVENELVKHGNILLITSRKAKVDETKLSSIFKGKFEANEVGNYVVYTNSAMERIIKNTIIHGAYNSFCEYFQYVVIDEAHSLITDSTFSEASFHLWSFIRKLSDRMKFILMTGTVKPIEKLLKDDGWHIIDCMEECINIRPNRIIIESYDNALKQIKGTKTKDEKIIYMANSATNIAKNLYEEIQKKCEISKREIALSMSDSKAESLLKEDSPSDYERLKETYESIVNNSEIPSNIKLLLTTSRLKEGINIKNDNINEIYCESHMSADILQFAGRVRTGVDTLYIVDGVKQNNNNLVSELDYKFCKDKGLRACTEYLESIPPTEIDKALDLFDTLISKTMNNPDIASFVKYVESRFDHIRYNHMENRFELYELRRMAVEQCNNDIYEYNKNAESYIRRITGISNVFNKAYQEKKIFRDSIVEIMQNAYEKQMKFFDDDKNFITTPFIKAFGLQTASIQTINNKLEEMGVPYKVDSKKETKGENRMKHYWSVVKID